MARSRIASLLEAADLAQVDQIEPIPDLTRAELVEAMVVCMSEIANEQEADRQEFMVRFLTRCLPGVFDSDLVFYPFKDLGVEDAVEEVLLRRRTKHDGGQSALNDHYRNCADQVLLDPDAKPWAIDWAQGVKFRLG